MQNIRVLRLGVLSFVLMLIVAPSVSAAPGWTSFHGHAMGEEESGDRFTGGRVTRTDVEVISDKGGYCGEPYEGYPVYQTMWIVLNSSYSNWIELGTGHQCAGDWVYWFWGYGYNGNWHPLGEQTVNSHNQHTFYLYRTDLDRWHFHVNSSGMAHLTWGVMGEHVTVGLESWDSTAAASKHPYGELQYTWNEKGPGGVWDRFSGRDTPYLNEVPPLCGRYSSNVDYYWYASINRSC